MQVNFTVHGTPKGKERPRFFRGRVYTPRQTSSYEQEIAWAAKAAGALPLELPVFLSVKAFFGLPKRRKPHQKPLYPCLKKPDGDNIAKIFQDGLNGIAYKDDAQVYLLNVEKRYSEEPRVEVTVSYGVTD